MNCVVVDIGNSSTSVGLCAGERISRIRRLRGHPVDPSAVNRKLADVIGGHAAGGAMIASVVPDATAVWASSLASLLGKEALVLHHGYHLGVRVDYPRPERIGADRLANASGAVARYGSPVIVADFGTALTFDVILKGDVYVGGVIAPGLPLMTDYLAEKTALLPHIRLRGRCHWVGRSTEGAMRIGARIGYRGIVREIVTYLNRQCGARFKLCATGGYAGWALKGMDMPFVFDPELTLYGLGRIFRLNTMSGGEVKRC